MGADRYRCSGVCRLEATRCGRPEPPACRSRRHCPGRADIDPTATSADQSHALPRLRDRARSRPFRYGTAEGLYAVHNASIFLRNVLVANNACLRTTPSRPQCHRTRLGDQGVSSSRLTMLVTQQIWVASAAECSGPGTFRKSLHSLWKPLGGQRVTARPRTTRSRGCRLISTTASSRSIGLKMPPVVEYSRLLTP